VPQTDELNKWSRNVERKFWVKGPVTISKGEEKEARNDLSPPTLPPHNLQAQTMQDNRDTQHKTKERHHCGEGPKKGRVASTWAHEITCRIAARKGHLQRQEDIFSFFNGLMKTAVPGMAVCKEIPEHQNYTSIVDG
jgi:hypothetical protein